MGWNIRLVEDVIIIGMNSNAVNCFNTQFLNDFKNMINIITTEEKYKDLPLVFTSEAPKAFSAGLDLKAFSTFQTTEDVKEYGRTIEDTIDLLRLTGRRTIAAIKSHCIAAGLFLILGCDVRVALKGNYKLGANEVHMGLSLPTTAVQVALMKLPKKVVFEALLTGKMYNPSEAYESGILDYLVDNEEDLLKKSISLAKLVNPLSMNAYNLIREQIIGDRIDRIKQTRENDLDIFAKTLQSENFQKLMMLKMSSKL
eukprot:TRINITY_DN10375_c0_g1_i1.p1 TRINITY_DN10375_c0_g1~~TRINITY_DN10375_c0_g1_i1.p1  ORF type:complete len:267 (+),score=29.25 TRINITY_DN10375_c0_g1_i1:34-801(+)